MLRPSTPKYPTKPVKQVAVEDRVILRKPHPCGSFEWVATRVGADIGLQCAGCRRRLMLTRQEFQRGARFLLTPLTETETDPWNPDSAPEAMSGED